MTIAASQFYITGGTLRPDALCYVERTADKQLYLALHQGEFCYVLTSRQMGKSSLMVRCATRLRQDGIAVVVLDLTAIGQNLTPEQWYDGLALRLGRQVGLEDEIDDFWRKQDRLGPAQRFFTAIREVVLGNPARSHPEGPALPGSSTTVRGDADAPRADHLGVKRLVVFVDEIDTVRSLPFSTDEFFAAIRECYNRRIEDPAFHRLTFCLLGVATPSDLIRDTQMTPFNIGHRVELDDFTISEAAPLGKGLGWDPTRDQLLLERIFYWTCGHPYLTQRLCQAVATDPEARGAENVDRLCLALFLTHRARERDDNLLFVRDRILRSGADLAGLLTLYDRARRGKCRATRNEGSGLLSILRLSGIVQVTEGWCHVRNRIYGSVFDRAWVLTNMPDAEQQRQKSAYRRGILWSASIAAVVIAILAGVISYAFRESRAAKLANADLQSANQETVKTNRKLGHALKQLEWQRTEELLSAGKAGEALARFGRFLRQDPLNPKIASRAVSVLAQNSFSLPLVEPLRHRDKVLLALFSPDGTQVATASQDQTARVWNAQTGQPITGPLKHAGPVNYLAFSPDGTRLITASGDRTARIWEVSSATVLYELPHQGEVVFAAFSPNGDRVATASSDRTARVWNARTGKPVTEPVPHPVALSSLAFSPDGKSIVSASGDKTARLWDAASGEVRREFRGHTSWVRAVQFSPDGELVVTASEDQKASVYEAHTDRWLADLRHKGIVHSASFSPDSGRVVTASHDQTARVWDARSGQPITEPLRHEGWVVSAQFSPDGQRVLTASRDGTARIWNARNGELISQPLRHAGAVASACFSPSGDRVLTACLDGLARLWDGLPGKYLMEPLQHNGEVRFAEFSPDASLVLTASADRSAKIWNRATGLPIGPGPFYHSGRIWHAEFSPDGTRVVTATSGNRAHLWNVATGQPLVDPLVHEPNRRVWMASFSLDGNRVATACADGTARIWNAWTGQPLAQLRGHSGPVRTARFSPDGKLVVTSSIDHTARLWDSMTGRQLFGPLTHDAEVNCAIFSPDARFVATGSADKIAAIWEVATGKLVAKLPHQSSVGAVQFSPDGQTLVTASDDQRARLWNVRTWTLATEPLLHTGVVRGAEFSSDGRRVVTASDDQTARVWDVSTGEPLTEPLRTGGTVGRASFSRDGNWVVTASSDRSARVWEAPLLDSPPPAWLADLVEAVAGQAFNEAGILESVPVEKLFALKKQLPEGGTTNVWARWAEWFLGDRRERSISPLAPLSTREYVSRRIQDGTLTALAEAAAWRPHDPVLLARLSRAVLSSSENKNPSREAEAAWYSARALALGPGNPEVMASRGHYFLLSGQPAEALKVLDRSLDLQPDDAWARLLRGRVYMGKQEWEKALADLNKSSELDGSSLIVSQLRQECLYHIRSIDP